MDTIVPISEARARLGDLIDGAGESPAYVLRHGRAVGVIMSVGKFEGLLDRVEDLEDRLAVATASDFIPFVTEDAGAAAPRSGGA